MYKMLERLVVHQFVMYLHASCLLPSNQSGFRWGYSTETAIIRVLSDLLDAVDHDDTTMLVLLYLSAAFETVNHGILLERLQVTFGVDNSALAWFWSSSAEANVLPSVTSSAACHRCWSLGWYSIIYITDLASTVADHGLSIRQYADNSSCQSLLLCHRIQCHNVLIASLKWMRSNRLQLNANTMEVMWCSSTRKLSQLPSCSFSVAGSLVCPVNSVCDLGVFVDNHLSAAMHTQQTVSRCFAALCQLHHLCQHVTNDCLCFPGSVACALMTLLRQICPGWASITSTEAPPVSSQRLGSSSVST